MFKEFSITDIMKFQFPFFKKKESTKPKSKLREWVDAIVFAVVVATFLRWLLLEAYTIPTSSMEGSLLTGDFLFVSKLHYGARTPKTPLQMPLTHQKIWLTNLPSYLTWIQLPQYRLPHFSEVKSGDAVVFNYPGLEPRMHRYPTDLRTNYIKRCVGVAGDSLEVKDTKVFLNGKQFQNHEKVQHKYYVYVKEEIPIETFQEMGLFSADDDKVEANEHDIESFDGNKKMYVAYINEKTVEAFKKMPQVTKVELEIEPKNQVEPNSGYLVVKEDGIADFVAGNPVFPNHPKFTWNRDNFGPVWIPKKGAKIAINENTLILYGFTIQEFEGYDKDEVKIEKNQLIIEGKAVTEYTFKQDYYFMMGDNRHRSSDSRYWGFVPADHVVGKALFIWMSWEGRAKWYKKIRWGRLFNGIN